MRFVRVAGYWFPMFDNEIDNEINNEIDHLVLHDCDQPPASWTQEKCHIVGGVACGPTPAALLLIGHPMEIPASVLLCDTLGNDRLFVHCLLIKPPN